jgi:hypothetical protein
MGRKSVAKNLKSDNVNPTPPPRTKLKLKVLRLRAALQKWLKPEYPAGKALSHGPLVNTLPLDVFGYRVNPAFMTAVQKISATGNPQMSQIAQAF